jgi:hypothetical protein
MGHREEGRKVFFFEKKKQKTFTSLGSVYPGKAEARVEKFFGSFFQKRTAYFSRSFRLVITRDIIP